MADAPAAIGHPTLVFDGDCGLCTTSARFVERRLATPDLVVVAWQRADLAGLGLTAAECTEAAQWVAADGTHAAGAQAIAAVLVGRGGPWRVLGRLLQAPGVRRLAAVAYRWVAANRDRLPGGTPACKVDPPA
jgi:predicted DCC family thiol-disulfide oxidoreductase YuxK